MNEDRDMPTSDTLDKLYLEWSQYTKARNSRELKMIYALHKALEAINPSQRGDMPEESYKKRRNSDLESAAQTIRDALGLPSLPANETATPERNEMERG